jgi:regulator of replication initiation timing
MGSEKENDALVEELLKSIQSTTSLIQSLMSEIKGNEKALTTLEVKLESLTESAKILSKIVRDDNGTKSILTRVALLENDLNDLYANYKEFKAHVYKKLEINQKLNAKIIENIENKIEILNHNGEEKEKHHSKKVIAALQIAPGIIALVLVVIKIFWGIDVGG